MVVRRNGRCARALRRALRPRRAAAARVGARAVLLRLLFVAMALYIALSVSVANARPTVAKQAVSEACDYVAREINEAIEEEIASGGLDYGKLVALEKDVSGRVTALVTNMAQVNLVCARITNGIIRRGMNTVDTGASIALGSIIGGVLLSGRGPEFPIKIQSITNVRTQFTNEFSDAGINQTRHTLSLIISAHIDVLVPGNETGADLTTKVAVAETIIVGSVPNVYNPDVSTRQ
ncbi:MAG: sporulation protein YunB [Oscillospiraceae bacterium]|nr:sporulation protein YunB [Oscillospiraceae bacterium]